MAREMRQLAWNQCNESMRHNDMISIRLERAFQGNMRDCALLQEEFNKETVASLRRNDVSEGCSLPRVVKFAEKFCFVEGWSLDFTTRDSEGKELDFSKAVMREKAKELVRRDQPTMVIGSPYAPISHA